MHTDVFRVSVRGVRLMVVRDIKGPGRPATSVHVIGQDRLPTDAERREARAAITGRRSTWTTTKLVREIRQRG